MCVSDAEIDYVRRQGKRWIPPKGAAGHFARIQDEKLSKEHAYELNKKNVCPRCHTVKSQRGACMC